MATRLICATCALNGCCVDLHHCGDSCWEPDEDGDDLDDGDPYDGPDEYDQWLHDADVWQESMDREY